MGVHGTEREPRALADAQGVRRPFDALASMSAPLRARLGRLLGVRLDRAGGDARFEAWLLLNADLKGLQARSHRPDRTLLPRRNHNWWEILLAAADRLGLDVYPGLSEREVESLVFDRIARAALDRLEAAEIEVLEIAGREAPGVTDAFDRLGLSPEGRLFVLAAFHRIAAAAPADPADAEPASRRTAAYLRAGSGGSGVLQSSSRTLRFLRDALPQAATAWEALAVTRHALPRSSRPLALALAVTYLHGLVGDCVEELEALRL